MNLSALPKKLSGAVILIAETMLLLMSAGKLTAELLPEWHRWNGRLTAVLCAVFLIISLLLYFLCEIRGRIRPLFLLWALVSLFLANTLYAAPESLQIVLAVFLMLWMIFDGLFGNTSFYAAVIDAFVILALIGAFLTPAVARIKKPVLYTSFENFWWDLFETRSDGGRPAPSPREIMETDNDGGIPDNVITNDPFPAGDETPVCSVRATYPLSMLHLFSCGDYDPATFSFSVWNEHAELPDAAVPSASYFRQALNGSGELPCKAVLIDSRRNKTMMLMPYCDFTAGAGSAHSFGDRFIYRYDALSSETVHYTFDPEARYRHTSSGYAGEVRSSYLTLPQEFEKEIRQFVTNRGMIISDPDAAKKIAAVRDLFSAEYTYSDTPPALPDGEDPVMYFLLKSKTGYSKHFAAAGVFLYRALGIPARYSFGYRIREYTDGEAEVFRYDAAAFCEVFVNGVWMLPEEVTPENASGTGGGTGTAHTAAATESADPVRLPNGYDISHLKGTASMFGSYDDGKVSAVSRNARSENDDTVVLVVDSGIDAHYIKAYSTGEYFYPDGSFAILSDTDPAPEFETGISFGEYAAKAFLCGDAAAGDPAAAAFRVFNLFAPRYIYTPLTPVCKEGLSGGEPALFGMNADRMVIPLSGNAAYDDYTLFAGGGNTGANEAYTKYVLKTYTEVPDEVRYELREFLEEHGIDADDPDKEALISSVRALLESYTYTTQIEPIPDEQDPVLWFLTVSRSGYCSHFAAAGTLLLRTCGIPARYVCGYCADIHAGSVTEITVKNTHTWTEVFDGRVWQPLEMCVGRPAEGEFAPSALLIPDVSYSLPSVAEAAGTPGQSRIPVPGILLAAALCLLAAALSRFIKKNRPDMRQKAYIEYRYIKEYYFISEDTRRLLDRITYSREGIRPEDLAALRREAKAAGSLLLYRRRYVTFAVSMLVMAYRYLAAVLENAHSHFLCLK